MNNNDNLVVIGADIGGSHITVARVDVNRRCLIGDNVRNKVDSKGSANNILNSWITSVKQCIDVHDGVKVKLALAMPGPFDYENGISLIKGFDKYESIYEMNIKNLFSEALSIDPQNILFRNDAESFLHGEMFCGAGQHLDKAIGLTLGTGFGSAISVKGVTLDLNLGSQLFRKSIADDYFATRWFIKRFWESVGTKVADVKDFIDVSSNDLKQEIFEEYAYNLSDFIGPILVKEDIKTVILGGNISKAQHFFLPLLKNNLLKQNLNIDFISANLNEEAALIGAAASFESIYIPSDLS